MHSLQAVLAFTLALYLHRLPDFRGKWKLLTPLRGVIDDIPVETRYPGVRLRLDVADRTNQLCVLGRHEATVARVVQSLAAGDCFVDVGANCGLYTVMAAHCAGNRGLVIAFEPYMPTYVKLVQNIADNGVRNVVPFNLAIAEQSGRSAFDVSTKGHSGRFSMAVAETTETEYITTVCIRDHGKIIQLIGDRPTIIKIDVEGFELAVLHGLAPLLERAATHVVVAEIDRHNLARYGTSPEAVYALMRDYGFTPRFGCSDRPHYDEVFNRPHAAAQT